MLLPIITPFWRSISFCFLQVLRPLNLIKHHFKLLFFILCRCPLLNLESLLLILLFFDFLSSFEFCTLPFMLNILIDPLYFGFWLRIVMMLTMFAGELPIPSRTLTLISTITLINSTMLPSVFLFKPPNFIHLPFQLWIRDQEFYFFLKRRMSNLGS